MEFSREVYLDTNFIHMLFPLATGFVILIAGLFTSTFQAFRQWRNKGSLWAIFDRVIFGLIGIVAGAIVFFTRSSVLLRDGGIYLPFETEADAVIRTGVVEQIEDRTVDNSFTRFSIGETPGYSWGNYVTIDGVRYVVVQWEGVGVGEQVTITCLPKSRCILSYNKTGDGSLP